MQSPKDAHIANPDILNHDVHDILNSDPFLATIHIDAVAPIIGGVAHRVYQIESGDTHYYLKIRGDHFAAIPSIICNPDDINNEYRALRLFGSAAPDHFPNVLSFDRNRHYLVLSDVIQDGDRLEHALVGGVIPDGLFRLYGQTLATIHRTTTGMTDSVRPEGDDAYYHTVLGHRFGYRNHPVLNEAVNTLSRLPSRQLIMGDPAPKNMGLRQNGQLLTFFDLETAHQGNPEFDYAYGLAHTLLHTIPNTEVMQQSVQDFLNGYGDVSYNPQLIYQLTLGIVLYRLHSIIPYPVALSSAEKAIMEAHIEQQLFTIIGKESWQDIVTQLNTL